MNAERRLIKKEHVEQIRAIRIGSKKVKEVKLPKELLRYKDAKIFDKDARRIFSLGGSQDQLLLVWRRTFWMLRRLPSLDVVRSFVAGGFYVRKGS